MTTNEFLNLSLDLAMGLVVLSIAIGFIRLAKGPTMSDRVVALDMMTTAIVAFCGLFAIRAQIEAYLDIAVALALVSFVSVVALARYAERQIRKCDTDD